MQPETWAQSPDYAEDVYEQDAINESEHMTGNKNNLFKGLGGFSAPTCQWVIVVVALGTLWAMHFNFRSTFKAVI